MDSSESSHLYIDGRRLEYRWFHPSRVERDVPIVMLHEGLGSASMWKGFPARLSEATGARVLAYSRFGYGSSDAPPRAQAALDMHEHEALQVLPRVLRSLKIERPILFGHSDGGSIALIYAGAYPREVCAVIALAPHLFVEPTCIASIEGAKDAYETTDVARKLARYHNDADGAFRLWSGVWLDPSFRAWNIEHFVGAVTCPVLGIQGYEDEYGTMEQLERLRRTVPQAELLKLERCRHSPHRDQPDAVLAATRAFMHRSLGEPCSIERFV